MGLDTERRGIVDTLDDTTRNWGILLCVKTQLIGCFIDIQKSILHSYTTNVCQKQKHTSYPLSSATSINKLCCHNLSYTCAATSLTWRNLDATWQFAKTIAARLSGCFCRQFVTLLCKKDFRTSTKRQISCIFMASRTPQFQQAVRNRQNVPVKWAAKEDASSLRQSSSAHHSAAACEQ